VEDDMEDTRFDDEPILLAVTYDETSEQFEERIISLVDARMRTSSRTSTEL
jgi:hypothetical protein